MPEKRTLERAKKDKRAGKSASTQAGEFVREEIHHVREGKHGAANAKQAIAIGLSKARRAGVKLGTKKGTPARVSHRAAVDRAKGRSTHKRPPSRTRSRAVVKALRKQPRNSASRSALATQARASAKRRGPKRRKAAAKKAARTRKAAAHA